MRPLPRTIFRRRFSLVGGVILAANASQPSGGGLFPRPLFCRFEGAAATCSLPPPVRNPAAPCSVCSKSLVAQHLFTLERYCCCLRPFIHFSALPQTFPPVRRSAGGRFDAPSAAGSCFGGSDSCRRRAVKGLFGGSLAPVDPPASVRRQGEASNVAGAAQEQRL